MLKHRKPKGEPVEMVQEQPIEKDKVQFADYVEPGQEASEKNIINVSNTQNKKTSDTEIYETENTVDWDLENTDNSIRLDILNIEDDN